MIRTFCASAIALLAVTGCASTAGSTQVAPAASVTAVGNVVTNEDMTAARKAWGDALVAISIANDNNGLAAATAAANGALDAAYGYEMGPVLFKPTLTSGDQVFRTTRDGALSYFVGNNPVYPRDSGFALKHWRSVETITAATFMRGDVAMWMGKVRMTDRDGKVTVVDKSWGYRKDANGVVRIVLHHSSLPYQP